LRAVDTRAAWAKRMPWKGRPPGVELNHTEYPRGLTLSKPALRAVEPRLERLPPLPTWDLLLRPATPA
jgi:hypothetical protein